MNKSRNSRCRVTAVIPVARPDDRLARAIQSIEGQTVRPTELIIVLDGEGDVTPFLPLSAQVPVRVIKQKQAGAAAARNRGVAEASFEWIAFLDADDQWHPEKLQRFQEALDQFPETRFFASRFLELTEHASVARGVPRRCCGRGFRPHSNKIWDLAMSLATPTVVVHRDELNAAGNFDRDLATAEDRDLWLKLLTKCPVYFDWMPLAFCHFSSQSLSNRDPRLDCECMMTVIDRHAATLGKVRHRLERSIALCKWSQRESRPEVAADLLRQSVAAWPAPLVTRRVKIASRPRRFLSILRQQLVPRQEFVTQARQSPAAPKSALGEYRSTSQSHRSLG